MEILFDIIRSMDYNILLLIADRLRGGVLDPVMTMLSLIGNGGAVWITLAVLLLFFRKTRRAGAAMLLAMLAGFLVGNLWLKELVMRPRPFVTHSDLTALFAPACSRSFLLRLLHSRDCTRAYTIPPMFLQACSSALYSVMRRRF